MNFATPQFLLFLVAVLAVVLTLNSPQWRKIFLLGASYVFYGTWNISFIALILLSTSIDYILSKAIFNSCSIVARKRYLTVGIILNLFILAVFKYFNFFVDSANAGFSLLHLNVHHIRHLAALLPLGISFYSFEAISYLVDVYRGDEPAKDFFDYNFYIMYFPHLISGPIVRYRELSGQIVHGIELPNLETLKKGIELIILGLIFKLIIADTVSSLADPVFRGQGAASISETYMAWAAFTTQIYFDFMGYTHIARGISLLFNIELPLNFNHPYNAANISDFWQRWHISLSRWIRDYLYIPLGGSRVGKVRSSLNLLLTMTIAGFWHGAGWAFIIWGSYHGVLLLLLHISKPVRRFLNDLANNSYLSRILYRVFASALTLLSVAYGWIWFRSPDAKIAMAITSKLFRLRALYQEQLNKVSLYGDYSFFATMILLVVLCVSGPLLVCIFNLRFGELPNWAKVQVCTVALVMCYIFSGAESKPFIYFQF